MLQLTETEEPRDGTADQVGSADAAPRLARMTTKEAQQAVDELLDLKIDMQHTETEEPRDGTADQIGSADAAPRLDRMTTKEAQQAVDELLDLKIDGLFE